MNQNITFRKAKREFIELNESEEDNDFNWNVDQQLKQMTIPNISESEKQKTAKPIMIENYNKLQNISIY